MQPWLISLIVILILLFVIFPSIVFSISGHMILKTFKKTPAGQSFKVPNMDISFYNNGPNKKLTEEGIPYVKSLEHEDLWITSFDGLKLHAHLYKNPNNNTDRYFIGFHGFKSHPRGEYGPYAKNYVDMGFNLVLVDERAHGESEGKYLTMGIKERFDVKSWADYIANRFGDNIQILIQGVSMGGASVCMASELDLPKQVIGIISDCAYSNVKEMLKYELKQFGKMPMFPFLNVISLYIKYGAKFDINKASPLEAVKHAKVPMIFFHGQKDQMVPVKFAYELYDACASKKKIIVNKDANHGETRAYENENYFNAIKEHFNL